MENSINTLEKEHTLDYNHLNEALLASWLRLSTSINNSRVVSEMTYNESLVCNVLYKHQITEPKVPITATYLCQVTKILKSQMHRTLNILEGKNIITRIRSSKDKRQVHIFLNVEQMKVYESQHQQILTILDNIIHELGDERAVDAIHLFENISDIADRLFSRKGEKND